MMAVTLEQIRRARTMSLADDLRMERDLVRHCFQLRPGLESETAKDAVVVPLSPSFTVVSPTERRIAGTPGVKPPTSRRPPVTVTPASDGVATTRERMASRISAALAAGFIDLYRAAAPVTCGVAIDVPLMDW